MGRISQILLVSIAFSIVQPAGISFAAEKKPTLFDLFFKNKNKKVAPRVNVPAPSNAQVQKKANSTKKVVSRPKIAAPSFYTYKATSLTNLQAKNIKAVSQPAMALGAFTAGVVFADALANANDLLISIEPEIAKAVEAYYAAQPEFLWVEGYHPTGEAAEVIALLADADSYGLESTDYAVEMPPKAFNLDNSAARAEQLLAFELNLSAKVLRYVQDVEGRRIDPNKLSGYHDFASKVPELGSVLASFAESKNDADVLLKMHPREPVYEQLRQTLAKLKSGGQERIVLTPKIYLKPGQSHPEFPQIVQLIARKASPELRQQFGMEINLAHGVQTYSPALVPLIQAWQKERGLKPDGVIGPNTIAATTDRSRDGEIDKVKLSLERMRWLPDHFSPRYVFINQPAYRVSYFNHSKRELSMNVVIGTKANQTNFFYDEISTVVFNPYWGVPQSILVNEMLPKMIRNPGYLDNNGYEVTTYGGKKLSSRQVNWAQYSGAIPFNVRQKPGKSNALGELKILFPNHHAIYMHDTPARHLFSRPVRAYSHGCVRLADPRAMAAAVLGTTKADVAAGIARGHQEIAVKDKMPVYLGYFTAWQNDDGEIAFYDDVYERDAYLLKALESVKEARSSGV